jgi:ribosomal protein S1
MSREEEIEGKVRTLTSFGAFVEFPDGVNGLCHISQLSDQRTEQVSDAVSVRRKEL